MIAPEKIGDIIGPGGKIIRAITDELDLKIDINDDGLVMITTTDPEKGKQAEDIIKHIKNSKDAFPIILGGDFNASSDSDELAPFKMKLMNTFDESKDDKNLIQKLTTPKALSSLLNRALRGYQRLLTQGEFTIPAAVANALEQYRRANEPIRAFLEEYCEINDQLWIPRTKLHEAYKQLSGYGKTTARRFYEEVRRILVHEVRESKREKEGRRVRL